tara:strand:+ start:201 stop:2048 length:1848 start_codon:yes stop_codon:yes gene_type:complete
MLTIIRDKLKTWVIIILLFLVAIPLAFLGVGDYGNNQEQYAFKVNDQEISKSVVLQEMGQFKDVLRKNYQGAIPPIYNDQFIKKITIDNLIRRNIENNISSSIGLALSDQSIIDDITNTSSFRDEKGFDSKLYKRRLFMINMNPDVYEQYIYQKGIREQLRKAITDTSILSVNDKKININANYHIKKGKFYLLEVDNIKKDINITLNEINQYYEQNKNSFLTNEEAEFEFIRLNKVDFINSIQPSKDELEEIYIKNLSSGQYMQDTTYDINHLVFPISDNKEEIISLAKNAYKELKSNKNFKYIVKNYAVSKDTKDNSGYLGKQSILEMPEIIKSNINNMKPNEIKLVTSESNAVHIIKLNNIQTGVDKTFEQVKSQIEDRLINDKGSKEYFLTLDKIKEKLYVKNISLSEISKTYNLKLSNTSRIDFAHKHELLTSNILLELFNNINNTNLYSPIYISNDDVLFILKKQYYPPEQLTLIDSENAIKALLMTQKSRAKISKLASNTLNNLNNGTTSSYQEFSVYKYDNKYDIEIMKTINNQSPTNKFISNKMDSGNYLLLKIDSIHFDSIDKEKVNTDNFLDYLDNTQSESDYNSFYVSKYNDFEIDINDSYLDQ